MYRLLTFLFLFPFACQAQFSVSGTVSTIPTGILSGARVTLFDSAAGFFTERRTDGAGSFSFNGIPAGTYKVGATKRGFGYAEQRISLSGNQPGLSFSLSTEAHPGQWQILKRAPEPLGGTDLAVLLSTGKIFYCHDTKDPFYFDPYTNDTLSTNGDVFLQGCVGPVLLPEGEIFFAGGANLQFYGPGTRTVKRYNPVTSQWTRMDNMLGYRWYPTVAKLPDNRILLIGGGDQANPRRTRSSELYNPKTGVSTWTDSIQIGNEVSPIVLLNNGSVLMTHRPPQLFNPQTMQWTLAADFQQGNRMPNGDHADHELTLMPDGKVVAIGFKTFNAPQYGNMVETYDPAANTWTLGAAHSPVRSRANTVLLPDENILVTGGERENHNDTNSVNAYKFMKLTESYNPVTDTWRRLADMNYHREYHSVPMLVADGRVIVAGGEGQPGNEPPFSVIEGFKPPYLFKGIRPSIEGFTPGDFRKGSTINFNVRYADSVTGIALISAACKTHFMNSGNNRFLKPGFVQTGNSISFTLPTDSVTMPDGLYMMFVLVDDIPSVGQFVTINDRGTVTTLPSSSLSQPYINIYPNPAIDGATILPAVEKGGEYCYRITDATGSVVKSGSLTLNPGAPSTFSLGGISAGLYIISLTGEGKTYSSRFLKQ